MEWITWLTWKCSREDEWVSWDTIQSLMELSPLKSVLYNCKSIFLWLSLDLLQDVESAIFQLKFYLEKQKEFIEGQIRWVGSSRTTDGDPDRLQNATTSASAWSWQQCDAFSKWIWKFPKLFQVKCWGYQQFPWWWCNDHHAQFVEFSPHFWECCIGWSACLNHCRKPATTFQGFDLEISWVSHKTSNIGSLLKFQVHCEINARGH